MNKNVLLVAMKVILSEFREGTYTYVRMGRVDTLRYTTGNENDGPPEVNYKFGHVHIVFSRITFPVLSRQLRQNLQFHVMWITSR
jgi:hypothetical protein